MSLDLEPTPENPAPLRRSPHRRVPLTAADVRLENARLKEEARRLRDDPAAIEEEARRDLGLIRPGETIIILKDAKPAK